MILILLYMDSCCCVRISRESRDISDFFNSINCNSISQSYLDSVEFRCKCASISSIVSTDTGRIACIRNEDIDRSKFTGILLYSRLFPINFIQTDSLTFEHLIPSFTFYEQKPYRVVLNYVYFCSSLKIKI